jgi:hypothetical protein
MLSHLSCRSFSAGKKNQYSVGGGIEVGNQNTAKMLKEKIWTSPEASGWRVAPNAARSWPPKGRIGGGSLNLEQVDGY